MIAISSSSTRHLLALARDVLKRRTVTIGTPIAMLQRMLAARSLNPDCSEGIRLPDEQAHSFSQATLDSPTTELLEKLPIAVWLIDSNNDRICWANQAGAKLFGAGSRELSLAQAPSVSQLLGFSIQRLPAQIKSSIPFHHKRTIKLAGREQRVEYSFSRWDRAPDPTWMFVTVRPIVEPEVNVQESERLWQSAPCVIATFSQSERLLRCNKMAQETFGTVFSMRSLFAHRMDYVEFTEQLSKEGRCHREALLYTIHGKRWYSVDAQKNPQLETDDSTIVFHAQDISSRVRAEHAKDELVGMVSHELRTPMTAIRGAVELLAGGLAQQDPTLLGELLGIASENTKRLQKLVDALLDLRKLANGRISIVAVPCDIAPLLQEAVKLQVPDADSKGVQISIRSDSALPILGDEGRMQQVLMNLLSNAVKHSPLGGEIKIHGAKDLDRIRITVTDDGPGIPAMLQERIFEPFSQLDSSSTRQDSGMGIGLYMAKTLVELHGGQLSFLNRPQGGTTFTIELPRRRSSAPR